MKTLRHQLTDFANRDLTAIGDIALDAFTKLPGASTWAPKELLAMEVDYVFNHGLPLALIGNNPTADRHRREIDAGLFKGAKFPHSRMSEVHACALFSYWGFNVNFIKEIGAPTPDMELVFDGGYVIDVEVARAETRKEHRAAFDSLGILSEALRPSDINFDLLLILQDASNLADVNELFQAACNLRVGEKAEKELRWFAQALPLGVLGSPDFTVDACEPTWWEGRPCLMTNSVMLSGSSQTTPTIRAYSKPPPASYEGPIARKAHSGQGRKGNPYLIVVDVTQMIGWQKRIEHYLSENFLIWPHVSGVITFETRFGPVHAEKLYISNLYLNDHAEFSLPLFLEKFGQGPRKDSFKMFEDERCP